MEWEPLIEAAAAAKSRAYAPYSGFSVGAAVSSKDGRVFAGCNVENRSFGATLCAEKVAITSAVVAGVQELTAVAVITDSDSPAPPCGSCLQVIAEFARPDLPVLLVGTSGQRQELRFGDLHPHPFELPTQGLGRRA